MEDSILGSPIVANSVIKLTSERIHIHSSLKKRFLAFFVIQKKNPTNWVSLKYCSSYTIDEERFWMLHLQFEVVYAFQKILISIAFKHTISISVSTHFMVWKRIFHHK